MVTITKKIDVPYVRKIGFTSLSAKNLLEMIRDEPLFLSSSITAESADYQFNSLSDLEENAELLYGNPVLKIETASNQIECDFSKGTVLTLKEVNEEAFTVAFEKLVVKLLQFRRPFYFMGHNFIMLICIVAIIVSQVAEFSFYGASGDHSLYWLLIRIGFFLLLGMIYGIYNLSAHQVVLSSQNNFWPTLHHRSLSNLIIFLGGALLFWVATKLGSQL